MDLILLGGGQREETQCETIAFQDGTKKRTVFFSQRHFDSLVLCQEAVVQYVRQAYRATLTPTKAGLGPVVAPKDAGKLCYHGDKQGPCLGRRSPG